MGIVLHTHAHGRDRRPGEGEGGSGRGSWSSDRVVVSAAASLYSCSIATYVVKKAEERVEEGGRGRDGGRRVCVRHLKSIDRRGEKDRFICLLLEIALQCEVLTFFSWIKAICLGTMYI